MKSLNFNLRLVVGLCFLCPNWSLGQTTYLTLANLLHGLAQQKAVHATFEEKKNLKALDSPLESSGELAFIPPYTMRKLTLEPKRELLELQGDKVLWERNGKTRMMNLTQIPEMAIHFEGIRALMAGDKNLLDRWYDAKLTGKPELWKLRLIPKQSGVSGLKWIEFVGIQYSIRQVEVQLLDGDNSVMSIRPSVTKTP